MAKKKILFGAAPTDGHTRITKSEDFYVAGGDVDTHQSLQDTAIKFSETLKRKGKDISELSRNEFCDMIAKAQDSFK